MKSPTPLQERARGKERRVRLILSPVVFLSQFIKAGNRVWVTVSYMTAFFYKKFFWGVGEWGLKPGGGYHREDGIRTTAAPTRVIDWGGINLA